MSVTYLVLGMDDGDLVGYFAIALKPLTVWDEAVNNTVKRKIMRIGEFDEQTKSYTMLAYLIAQIGKISQMIPNKHISNSEFLELAWSVIEDMQYMGGEIEVFLEANDEGKLLTFYQNNNFQRFDTRLKAADLENYYEQV